MSQHCSRRQFVASAVALLLLPNRARAMRSTGPHPTPRPGITAAKVPTSDPAQTEHILRIALDGLRYRPAP